MAFTPAAGEIDFARDVRPWLGDDAALALLPGAAGAPQPLLVASVRDSGSRGRRCCASSARGPPARTGAPSS